MSAKYYEFGARLKKLRIDAKIGTQGDLAKLIGASESSVCAWERGVKFPEYKLLVGIIRYFKCDAHWLVTGLTFDDFLEVV
jgi:DNA-binding XRE family transcriptional regulator